MSQDIYCFYCSNDQILKCNMNFLTRNTGYPRYENDYYYLCPKLAVKFDPSNPEKYSCIIFNDEKQKQVELPKDQMMKILNSELAPIPFWLFNEKIIKMIRNRKSMDFFY